MTRPTSFSSLALLALVGGVASAQPTSRLQGPLLLAPGRSGSESSFERRSTDYRQPTYRGSYSLEPRREPTVSPDDPRLGTAETWHRRLFGRRPDPTEWAAWSRHFGRNGTTYDLLAGMIAGDEYFERTGGNFEDWFASAAEATGRPVTSKEVWEWGIVYRQDRDRLALARRLLDVSGLLNGAVQHQVARPIQGHVHASSPSVVYGAGSYGVEHDDHDHYGRLEPDHHEHAGHGHTAGYGPIATGRPSSGPEQIAEWYRTYNGREIQPNELNKWVSDLNKGMPMDEVFASVLGGDEWYARTGSSAPSWVASTLAALGQRADQQSLDFWLDRFRRNGGERYRTALEMVRRSGGGPAAVEGRGDDDRRRRDRHDNDD